MGYYAYRSSKPSSMNARRNNRSGGGTRRKGAVYIDPARFVQAAKPASEDVFVPLNTFADFKVNQLIKDNLAKKGYLIPTPIQDQAIPLALEGKDVIGVANTGTGKTAAFALPLLEKLMSDRASNALIIAPVRELAQQIEEEFKSIAKDSGLSGTTLIGGSSMSIQLRSLKGHPRVIIGTPGRIKDHLQRGSLDLSKFNVVVVDEVDRMLDMGFINDVRFILNSLSPVRQSFFFSATMSPSVSNLIRTFASEPVMISLKLRGTSENVHQDVVRYSGTSEKLTKLQDILISEKVTKVIVFDETKRSVERLSNELIARGFKADAIHGGKTQGQRQRALRRFKGNEINILVATDVAARGIDVSDVSHVINYATPNSYEDYIHRIGRAGRAGNTGYALTFVAS